MSGGGEPAVVIDGLVCDFPGPSRGLRVRAVEGLSLEIPRGVVFGLLGPNGSGKSTTIKALLGLVTPVAGAVRVGGRAATDRRARLRVGYLPEAPQFQPFLTGRELVRLHAHLGGVAGRGLEARVAEVLARVGMTGAADRRLGGYSKGMLQRVGLAQALVHDPELLVLDEPTAGVDPAGCEEMLGLIRAMRAEGRTVLITSHLLGQIEDVCDRIAILHRGRLLAAGLAADLIEQRERQQLTIDALDDAAVDELRAWLQARGRVLHRVAWARDRLDRYFLRVTTEGGAAHE